VANSLSGDVARLNVFDQLSYELGTNSIEELTIHILDVLANNRLCSVADKQLAIGALASAACIDSLRAPPEFGELDQRSTGSEWDAPIDVKRPLSEVRDHDQRSADPEWDAPIDVERPPINIESASIKAEVASSEVAHVFISYVHDPADSALAQLLAEVLKSRLLEVHGDWSIRTGSDWGRARRGHRSGGLLRAAALEARTGQQRGRS